ncbi:tRNA wybutosine-synthesizing protein 5 [Glycine soja]
MNSDSQANVQLETLREDIQMPQILASKELSSINLWMNNAQARSSTRYDPQSTPQSSVHSFWLQTSSVTLENPDHSIYPRAECSMEVAQKVIFQAGDALFIPEGWFHQADSDGLTIAINFWWRSNIMSCMLEHMDAYYLRRILRRGSSLCEGMGEGCCTQPYPCICKEAVSGFEPMTNKSPRHNFTAAPGLALNPLRKYILEKRKRLSRIDARQDQLLLKLGMGKTKLPNNGQADHADENYGQMLKGMDLREKKLKERNTLLELEPAASQVLHELVSLVHKWNDKCEKIVTADLKDDPLAKILWDVEPQTLQCVFLAMAHNLPRTLEALVLHVLSPVGVEVLTRKFDEMEQQTLEEDRNRFYEVFYSAFDDQSAAMNSILKGKELFTEQAFKNVLDKFVGVNLES